jgi:hypothetical protein
MLSFLPPKIAGSLQKIAGNLHKNSPKICVKLQKSQKIAENLHNNRRKSA